MTTSWQNRGVLEVVGNASCVTGRICGDACVSVHGLQPRRRVVNAPLVFPALVALPSTGRIDRERAAYSQFISVVRAGAGDHLSQLGDGLPPGGEGDEGEHEVRGTDRSVQLARLLRTGEPLDLLPVVTGALVDIGGGPVLQPLPLQKPNTVTVSKPRSSCSPPGVGLGGRAQLRQERSSGRDSR